MKHLNGNILAVVDCETTGDTPGKHDILEICVLPLNNKLEPILGNVFNISIKPMRPENIDFEALRCQPNMEPFYKEHVTGNKERIVDATLKGIDPYEASELFVRYFESLHLAPRKRIMPIAQNWPFDRGFIIEWLGMLTFDYIFDPRFRDTLSASLFMNDFAEYRGDPYPFQKNNLQYICLSLGVTRERKHTALDDCIATAEIYKRMVRQFTGRTLQEVAENKVEE